MDDPLIALLAGNRVFQGLTAQQLQDVRTAGTVRKFKAGSFILRQGDPSRNLFVMFCGNAKLTHLSPDGREALKRFVRPGDGYGIASVLGDVDYLWSLQAIDDCQMFVWSGEAIADLMERYARIMFNTLRIVITRQHEMQDRYLEILTLSVEQRLAQAVLRLCNEVGSQTAGGCLVDVILSRGDLAKYTGTTVFTVSRLLSKWERQGWVRTGRERVVVLDENALETLTSMAPESGSG